jgi:RNA polymerase sigma-70 factor, ECF subfamily
MRTEDAMPVNPAEGLSQPQLDALDDNDLVQLVRVRDEPAVRTLTRRYNRRLFRLARSILRNDTEAEDVVQETWMRAFGALDSFRGDAAFATWLTRIALNEALGRKRKQRPTVDWETYGENRSQAEILQFPVSAMTSDPERRMAQSEIRQVLERSVDELPEAFRTVFVARVVEGMDVEETATLFGLKPETVKTRLHRARALLREALDRQLGPALVDTFPFAGLRCARMTETIVQRYCRSG